MLLDTSGVLCFLNQLDPFYQSTGTFWKTAAIRLTHNYVVAELIALGHVRRANRTAVLQLASDLLDAPEVEFVWVDRALHDRAMTLLRARPDKSYSLCDAVSFVLMRDRGIVEALTTDRHFEQEGFVRLLK